MKDNNSNSFPHLIGACIVAAVMGFGIGALMAKLAPSNKFSVAGLLLVPAWLVIELVLELAVDALGAGSRASRTAGSIGIVGGFYLAWFLFRA